MKLKIFICFTTLIFFLASSATLKAEIIILKDGTVLIGEIKSATSKGIVIESLGTQKTFNQKSIQKNTANIKDIQDFLVEVTLNNGSVMKGYIQNYEKEVGLLLKTDYGPLTMPSRGINSIQLSNQKKDYTGPRAVVGVMAGCYFPVGPFKERFQMQPHLSAFAEFNSMIARGLFFGVDTGYMFMQYRPDRDVRFDAGTLKVYVQYRFLDVRALSSPARFFCPFISAGAGFAYIARRDLRPFTFGSKRYKEVDAVYTAAAGLDIFATNSFIIRIQVNWLGIQQNPAVMNAFSTNLGFMWGF